MLNPQAMRYILVGLVAQIIVVATTATAAIDPVAPLSTGLTPTTAEVTTAPATPLPLQFVPNVGQWRPDLLYLTRAADVDALFKSDHIELHLNDTDTATTLRLRPLAANTAVEIQPSDPRPTLVHDYRGQGPEQWHTNIPTYEGLRYVALYPDIDLAFRTQDHQLAYDFILHPGADPSRIRIAVEGAQALSIESDGSLSATLPTGRTFRQLPPFIYQEHDGVREPVSGQFQLLAEQASADSPPVYGFEIGAYDPTGTLIVDPTLTYSSFVGGSSDETISDFYVDSSGATIVVGTTASSDFPTTSDPATSGRKDGFVYKINVDGTALQFVVLLGGSSDDEINALDVDSNNNNEIYVVGKTSSNDFPIINPLFGVLTGRSDAFVTKLDSSGLLITDATGFSSYFGGNGETSAKAIGLDQNSNIYIAGVSSAPDLVLRNPIQAVHAGDDDGFIARFAPDGTALGYATYFGGSDDDSIDHLIVSDTGDLFFAGQTKSPATDRDGQADFPLKNPLQSDAGGDEDGFLARIARGGIELIFNTYLGGEDDDILTDFTMDSDGHYFVSGYTSSSNWTTVNALQSTYPEGSRSPMGLLAKVDRSGRFFHFSTYLGAASSDQAFALTLDDASAANGTSDLYVAGRTESNAFPVQNSYQHYHAGLGDGFITRLDPSGQIIRFSSYFGGIKADEITAIQSGPNANSVIFAGHTQSAEDDDFPVGNNPTLNAYVGRLDTFVSRLDTISSDPTEPVLWIETDLAPLHPEAPTAASQIQFQLKLKDRAGPGVIAFKTELYYNPEEIGYDSITWAPGSVIAGLPEAQRQVTDHGDGRLEIYVYQDDTGGSSNPASRIDIGLTNNLLATLSFNLLNIGTAADDPPLSSQQVTVRMEKVSPATIEGDLDDIIFGLPGSRLIERRCNSLLGDCDCSGRVQLFEVQSAVTNALANPTAPPICVKSDYATMAPGDLTDIVNHYINGDVEVAPDDDAATASAEYAEAALSKAIEDRSASAQTQAIGRLDFGQPRIDANQVTYDLTLTSSEEPSVAVADLYYDPEHVAQMSVTTGPAAASVGKQTRFNLVEPGWMRILVYGINQTTLPNGVVGTLALTLASGREVDGLSLNLQTEAATATSRSATFDSNAVIDGIPTPISAPQQEDCSTEARRISDVYETGSHYLRSEQTITVTGTAAVNRDAELTLIAPSIRFEPGFRVAIGGQLSATAGPVTCSALAASASTTRSHSQNASPRL